MTKLGGRKFIGFIILMATGLICVARGINLDYNVVALLLGAYGIFASTNLIAGRGGQDVAAAPGLDQNGLVDYLNTNLMPHINGMMQAQKETSEAVSVITERVAQHAAIIGNVGSASGRPSQRPEPRSVTPVGAVDGGVSEVRDLATRIMNGENPYSPRS